MSEPTRPELHWPAPPDHPPPDTDASASGTFQVELPLDEDQPVDSHEQEPDDDRA